MTYREKIQAVMAHKEIDRIPMWDYAWGETVARWHNEGLPEGVDALDYFGIGDGFGREGANTTYCQWTCMFPGETIEDTAEYTICKNEDGVTAKSLKNSSAPPFWSDYPIYDRESYIKMRPHMLWNEKRIDIESAKRNQTATQDRYQMYMEPCCGFERYKYIMGTEGILLAMGEDAGWASEMMMDTAELAINGLEHCLGNGMEFDAAFVTEDMGYAFTPFFSKQMYRDIIMPAQKRFNDYCRSHGMKVLLHSCGYVMPLLPLFIEAGYDAINPMEVKAGMDLLAVKRDYGDVLALWGGIDIRVFGSDDPNAIEKEIAAKVPAAMKNGGYIFASDHSIPPSASLEQYGKWLKYAYKYGTYK